MEQQHPETEAAKGTILIVDDAVVNLRLLSSILSRQGYHVACVESGPAGVQHALEHPPDLVLLDITMPDMDGYQVCAHLKEHARTRDIPIIFISALDEVLDKVKAFSVGGVDYIPKPFQVQEVLARVATHLTMRRLQRQLQAANMRLQEANSALEQRVLERTTELVELNTAYERFVPREFLSLLGKQRISETHLGDYVQQIMTVLFADIRSFTTLAEHMSPQESFNFLNSYLQRVSPIIRTHNGFIDNYIGDAIMAIFPHCAEDALQAAIALFREVDHYNIHRNNSGYAPISIGVGIHTGCLMLGVIGEEQRMQGTVIADAVNLAARLEALTKTYGASIIISEQVLQALPDPERYHFRFVDRVQVKGKNEAVSVFEIFDGTAEDVMTRYLETRSTFEEGLALYQNRKFTEASVKFNNVLSHNPDDKAARRYLQRAAHFMVHGVPADWMGVERMYEA